MQEPTSDRVASVGGWALFPITFLDGQECPSYERHGAIDVPGAEPPQFPSRIGSVFLGVRPK